MPLTLRFLMATIEDLFAPLVAPVPDDVPVLHDAHVKAWEAHQHNAT